MPLHLCVTSPPHQLRSLRLALIAPVHTHRLERPLMANVSLSYKPTLHKWMPLLQQAGLEDLTIEFPAMPSYNGHLKVRCRG